MVTKADQQLEGEDLRIFRWSMPTTPVPTRKFHYTGWTQLELAKALGVCVATIRRWEGDYGKIPSWVQPLLDDFRNAMEIVDDQS